MRFLLIVLGLLFVGFSASAYEGSSQGRSYLSPVLGFFAPGNNTIVGTNNNTGKQVSTSFIDSGLVGLGADYDYMLKDDVSFGGMARYYSCSTSIDGTSYTDSIFMFGPDVRAYFNTTDWVGYFDTGFDVIFPSYTSSGGGNDINMSTSVNLAWMIGFGALYKFTDRFALGFETTRLIGLSNSVNGVPLEDYMVKGRFSLN